MNKWDFVKKVSVESGLKQDTVNDVLKAMVNVIVAEVRDNGEDISLPGLGTFKQKYSAARIGRNPATGEKVEISESRTIVFKSQPSVKIKG